MFPIRSEADLGALEGGLVLRMHKHIWLEFAGPNNIFDHGDNFDDIGSGISS